MVSESSEIMQFWVTIATNYQVLTLHMNISYVVGLFVCCVYSLSADNIWMWICEVCFIFTMEYDFVYEHLQDLKNIVFWDVALCGSGLNRRFGGTYRLHLQGR
jgi:hypothetical protein